MNALTLWKLLSWKSLYNGPGFLRLPFLSFPFHSGLRVPVWGSGGPVVQSRGSAVWHASSPRCGLWVWLPVCATLEAGAAPLYPPLSSGEGPAWWGVACEYDVPPLVQGEVFVMFAVIKPTWFLFVLFFSKTGFLWISLTVLELTFRLG